VDPDKTSDKPETRSAYWKKQFRGLSPQQAYDLVVREDNVEAYRQFLVLYPSAPNVARVRVIADRRQEMVAWYTATTANSVAAYRYFLAKYGSSDMATMAQGLMMRAATRSLLAGTDPAALGLQVATTCNCSAPPTRRADTKPDKKSKTTRSTRRDSAPAEDVVVPASSGPPVGIGIGIGGFGGGGFGGGGLGGGRPGGGPIGQPPSSGGNIRR
jgi:hypothetical protein